MYHEKGEGTENTALVIPTSTALENLTKVDLLDVTSDIEKSNFLETDRQNGDGTSENTGLGVNEAEDSHWKASLPRERQFAKKSYYGY